MNYVVTHQKSVAEVRIELNGRESLFLCCIQRAAFNRLVALGTVPKDFLDRVRLHEGENNLGEDALRTIGSISLVLHKYQHALELDGIQVTAEFIQMLKMLDELRATMLPQSLEP